MDETAAELFGRFDVGVGLPADDCTDALIGLMLRIRLERRMSPKLAAFVFHPQDPDYLWLKSQIDTSVMERIE